MDTDIKFQNLTYDLCFKNLFIKEHILKDFINSFFQYLGVNINVAFIDIKNQKYIVPQNKNYIGFLGDIVATLDNETIISFEMYRNSFNEKCYNKSYAYMCRLFDENIENSTTYKAKKIISLNLMNGNYRRNNHSLVNKHEFRNTKTEKPSDKGNTIMYLIRLDKLKNMPYTNCEIRFIKWLKLINASSIEEMEEIGKGDEIMDEAIEFVRKWNNKSPQENFDNYVKSKMKFAYGDGEDAAKLEIAKNLINFEFKTKDIAKITGLTETEIRKVKREIK